MSDLKIRAKVDGSAWNELRALASESHRGVQSLLTEAVREYVARHRVRPEVMRHLEESVRVHGELGRRLAC